MKYKIEITKLHKSIFIHEFEIKKDSVFGEDVQAGIKVFRQRYPEASLLDDDVKLVIAPA